MNKRPQMCILLFHAMNCFPKKYEISSIIFGKTILWKYFNTSYWIYQRPNSDWIWMERYHLKVSKNIFSYILSALSAWICWFIITKLVFSIECKCVVHNDVSLFTTLLFPSLYIDIYHTWEREIIYCTLSENISRLHFITFNMHLTSCIFSAEYIG